MDYSIEVFKRQYPVLNDFVYHYIAYRELSNKFDLLPGDKEFWIRSTDAHLKVAITSWCMIFGAESNLVHWKKIIIEDHVNFCKEFRNCILKECGFNDKEWDDYWNDVVKFRNTFIVHRELYSDEPMPYIDKSFKIAISYDLWVSEKIKPDYLEDPTLFETSDRYRSNIEETLSSILK